MNAQSTADIRSLRHPIGYTDGLGKELPSEPNLIRNLQLSDVLTRTMEVREMVGLFAEHLQSEVHHEGLAYANEQLGLKVEIGTQGQHSLGYRIVVSDQDLGELTVSRSRLFAASEADRIEAITCALVYPLRNAILYNTALRSAFRDPLTGVNNRAALDSALPREIRLAQRHNTPTTLLVIDCDRFKQINDNHGHQLGDQVLCFMTGLIRANLRDTDLVYRYGGDEFVVLLSGTNTEGAERVAERIRRSVETRSFTHNNLSLVLSASIGLTQLNGRDSLESVFYRADEALLRAKRLGRNRVAIA